jgi:hypothetical protein
MARAMKGLMGWRAMLIATASLALGTSAGCALPTGVLPTRPQKVQTTDCAGARAAAIEILRDLGYAVVGVYDPMPGRLAIIAAEKQTANRRFQSNLTIRCEEERVEVIASQPTLAFHDPHFEGDFRDAWESRTGGRVARPLQSSGPIEVTRGTEPVASPPRTSAASSLAGRGVSTEHRDAIAPPAQTAHQNAPQPIQAPAAAKASEPSERPDTIAPPPEKPAVATSAASGRPAAGATTIAPSPSVRFDLLSAAESRARFGADLGVAGLTAARVGIVNRTTHTYLLSLPLLTLVRPSGDAVAPLTWANASARIAQSPAGQGWKSYDDISRELIGDQVLGPGDTVSGVVLYPAGDYSGVQVVLVDRDSARSERFEAAIPP